MYKRLFQFALAVGLGLFVYIYFFNFDNLSETEMVNAVLYWYVPLIFGIYGLLASRIQNKIPEGEDNVLKYLFSGKDLLLLLLAIVLAVFGILGFVLLILPLAIFKVNSNKFAISVALTGAGIMLLLLYLFFKVLWPAL